MAKNGLPTGEEIREAFAEDPRAGEAEQKENDKAAAKIAGEESKIERNTFTMSLVVTILGLICLPNVERGGSTWYVLMLVFLLNGALLVWILIRILRRRARNRQGTPRG